MYPLRQSSLMAVEVAPTFARAAVLGYADLAPPVVALWQLRFLYSLWPLGLQPPWLVRLLELPRLWTRLLSLRTSVVFRLRVLELVPVSELAVVPGAAVPAPAAVDAVRALEPLSPVRVGAAVVLWCAEVAAPPVNAEAVSRVPAAVVVGGQEGFVAEVADVAARQAAADSGLRVAV